MKEVKIEEKVTTIKYEAIDGELFSTKSQCITYEETVACLLKSKIKKLVIKELSSEDLFGFWICDENLSLLEVKTQEDIDNILKLYYYYYPGYNTTKLEALLTYALNNDDIIIWKQFDSSIGGEEGFEILTTINKLKQSLDKNTCMNQN